MNASEAPTTRNAIVTQARIMRDEGHSKVILTFDYGTIIQSTGYYNLNLAPHIISRMLDVCSADEWVLVPGKSVRVVCSHDCIYRIGHITRDDWLFLEEPELEETA